MTDEDRDQLILYTAAKVAKIDAEITALHAVFLEQENILDLRQKSLPAAVEASASLRGDTLRSNMKFLCDTFPEHTEFFRDYLSLPERELSDLLNEKDSESGKGE